jgi:hypothetical protein
MIFYIFSPKNSAEKMAFLTQNKAKLCKNWIITLVLKKKTPFFRRKLSKIAENCDHNIDPRLGEFFAQWVIVYFGQFFDNCVQ